jgi:hypothetical protein
MARSGYYRPPQQSEMAVFTRAKELSKAIFVVTQDAPKKFRFSLVSRLQDTSLAVVGHLYRANEVFMNPSSCSIANSLSTGCQESSLHGINCLKKAASEMANPIDTVCGVKLVAERAVKRLDEQTEAMACLKELDHLLVLAREMQCINVRQHEQLSVRLAETIKLLGGWIRADQKRIGIKL